MTPIQHFIHVFVVTFKDSFYTAVGNIAHSAGKVEIPGCLLCCRAEEYSLHSAANIYVNTFHNLIAIISYNKISRFASK